MKHLIFIFLLSFLNSTENGCMNCHLELDDDRDEGEKIVTPYLSGVHAARGISCVDCHGGDPEEEEDEDAAMWDADDFMGELEKADQLEMCGKCHSDPGFMRLHSASIKTDQVQQYHTSGHGKALFNGNDKAAICTDCHGVHGMQPVKDPRSSVYALNIPFTCSKCHSDPIYMEESQLPTDQLNDYQNSVHGKALLEHGDIGAPACNDCHGNHGAAPPDVVHVKDICGTCHVNNRNLFQKSHLFTTLMEKGFGQCETCHDNHNVVKPDDSFLDWSGKSLCRQCHPEGGEAKDMSQHFYSIIDSLKTGLHLAHALVDSAEQKGMIVDDLFFHLEEARKTLIHTRTNIHSFDIAYVDTHAIPGFTAIEAAISGAGNSLEEFKFRRSGLFYFSLIITFLVFVLGFKIKGMTDKKIPRSE